jgi:hypothetical protein
MLSHGDRTANAAALEAVRAAPEFEAALASAIRLVNTSMATNYSGPVWCRPARQSCWRSGELAAWGGGTMERPDMLSNSIHLEFSSFVGEMY